MKELTDALGPEEKIENERLIAEIVDKTSNLVDACSKCWSVRRFELPFYVLKF